MRYTSKSIDGVSPSPKSRRPQQSPRIHSVSSRQRLDVDSQPVETGGVFGVSSFARSLQPVSIGVEPERFVETRPLS